MITTDPNQCYLSLGCGGPSCTYLENLPALSGAPLEVTADLINTFNISLVVRGSISETHRAKDATRYLVPKEMRIFRWVPSPTTGIKLVS